MSKSIIQHAGSCLSLIVRKWEAVSLSDFIRSSVSILQQKAARVVWANILFGAMKKGDILYLLAYSQVALRKTPNGMYFNTIHPLSENKHKGTIHRL